MSSVFKIAKEQFVFTFVIMQCIGCSTTTKFVCGGCKIAPYCSKACQTSDYTPQHRFQCASSQIGLMIDTPETRELFVMKYKLGHLPNASWLESNYRLEYLSHGAHGLIFNAVSPKLPGMQFVIKFSFDDTDGDLKRFREPAIQTLLTKLYVGSGDDFLTVTPFIKCYDWGFSVLEYEEREQIFGHLTSRIGTKYYNKIIGGEGDTEVNAIVMEKHAGSTLHDFLYRKEITYDNLAEILAQIILILYTISSVVKFTHGDLSPANIFVTKTAVPAVYHYDISSADSCNVRTQYFVQIGDLGESYIEYSGPAHQDPTDFIPLTRTQSIFYHMDRIETSYKPWADFHYLALRIYEFASKKILVRSVARALASMIVTDWGEYPSQDYPGYPSREIHPVIKAVHDDLIKRSEGFVPDKKVALTERELFFVPTPRMQENWEHSGSLAEKLLKENYAAFEPFFAYRPTASDKIIDLTPKVGNASPALAAAWPLAQKLANTVPQKRKEPTSNEK